MRKPLLSFVLLAVAHATVPAFAAGDDAPVPQHKAKATLDDRADPNVRTDDVGKGKRMGRKDLPPGAYLNDKARQAVKAWFAAHPGGPPATQWHIGEKLPQGATALPPGLLGKLPKAPPGLRYVQLGSDVLLVADGSRMVVDGIAAP